MPAWCRPCWRPPRSWSCWPPGRPRSGRTACSAATLRPGRPRASGSDDPDVAQSDPGEEDEEDEEKGWGTTAILGVEIALLVVVGYLAGADRCAGSAPRPPRTDDAGADAGWSSRCSRPPRSRRPRRWSATPTSSWRCCARAARATGSWPAGTGSRCRPRRPGSAASRGRPRRSSRCGSSTWSPPTSTRSPTLSVLYREARFSDHELSEAPASRPSTRSSGSIAAWAPATPEGAS